MFAGDEETVTLYCKNEMANVIIDRFGKNVPIVKVDDEHFHSIGKSIRKPDVSWLGYGT
jgi:hypothetical protein